MSAVWMLADCLSGIGTGDYGRVYDADKATSKECGSGSKPCRNWTKTKAIATCRSPVYIHIEIFHVLLGSA
ncbi:hypothetical protein GOP47_0000724 [Adiantum capillus-veneris]|uniref:Uncharacterized protein n=1 Tax=Adiantum capillus-veneris TaxID=13818 RepID=A0A9D4VDI7_ADICA|nr:hypothetical protein GOP47_0000724 [Adiantum capillus-veneris]